MQVLRGGAIHRGDIELLEDVEHLEGGEALGIGRKLVDLVSAIRRGDRFDPVRAVRREIVGREQSASLRHVGGDRFRDRAAVERVAPFARDRLKSGGELWIREDLASSRRPSIDQERSGCGRVLGQRGGGRFPLVRNDGRYREPITGVCDRRLERACERDRTEASNELRPAIDRARNRH